MTTTPARDAVDVKLKDAIRRVLAERERAIQKFVGSKLCNGLSVEAIVAFFSLESQLLP